MHAEEKNVPFVFVHERDQAMKKARGPPISQGVASLQLDNLEARNSTISWRYGWFMGDGAGRTPGCWLVVPL